MIRCSVDVKGYFTRYMLFQELELACGGHLGVNDALMLSRDAAGGTTPGLAGASHSSSGLHRFAVGSTHSPSIESPFHSHASKLSSPSAMGVSGLSRINSPSLSRVNAQRLVARSACVDVFVRRCVHDLRLV